MDTKLRMTRISSRSEWKVSPSCLQFVKFSGLSHYLKNFKLICWRKATNFESLEIRTSTFSAIMQIFTDYTCIMLVSFNPDIRKIAFVFINIKISLKLCGTGERRSIGSAPNFKSSTKRTGERNSIKTTKSRIFYIYIHFQQFCLSFTSASFRDQRCSQFQLFCVLTIIRLCQFFKRLINHREF